MQDLRDPNWIKLKAVLFALLGLLASALLLLKQPTVRSGLLLIVAIWSFCRFYFFAFYVIEHYLDPAFRFSGLLSMARYFLFRKRRIR